MTFSSGLCRRDCHSFCLRLETLFDELNTQVWHFRGEFEEKQAGQGYVTCVFCWQYLALLHALQVDIFQDKCQKEMEGRNQREFQERVGDKQASFMQKWSGFATEKHKFLKEEYEPEMLRRQPGGPGIDVSRQPSVAAKPPTLAERFWPPMPATPPHIVQKQRATLERLDKKMKDAWLEIGHN